LGEDFSVGYHNLSVVVFFVLLLQPALVQSGLRPASLCHSPSCSLTQEDNAKSGASEYFPTTPATINDFYINNTQTGSTTAFTFNVSDSVSLYNATFTYDNGTGGASWYAQTNTSLSGTGPLNVTFNINPYSVSTLVNFTFQVCNTNSSLGATTGYRTLAIYSTSMPYTSLGKAISTIQSANSWSSTNGAIGFTGVQPYEGLILNQNTTAQYESVIDSCVAGTWNSVGYTLNSSWIDPSIGTCSWTNPSYACDGDITTGASTILPSTGGTTYYLVLRWFYPYPYSLLAYDTNWAEYWIYQNVSATITMYIDVSSDSQTWTNIYTGSPAWEGVKNSTFSKSVFSIMRYHFSYSGGSGTIAMSVNETQVQNVYKFDWEDALANTAYMEKMNLTWADKQADMMGALGNITMVGSLPSTDGGAYHYGFSSQILDFAVTNEWALYGLYYAYVYNTSLTKWNITAAFNQFDNAVNYSTVSGGGLPLWIFAGGTGVSFTNRYYDEDAETIQAFLIFYYLLNVTVALDRATHWWNYLVNTHWSTNYGGYFKYRPDVGDPAFECEAGFFFKIANILKYYSPNLLHYSDVLSDIENRFLSNEWNSYQWMDSTTGTTAYATVHEYSGNDQRRTPNTLGAWQALLAAYLLMNTTYRNNMADMLAGNTTKSVQPAWSLLMSSTAGVWDSSSKLFRAVNNGGLTSDATAIGEITLFYMGIIPQTSTIAFPLEELKYEYIFDIDPLLLAFDFPQDIRQITVPVVQAGTITFQYGESPTNHTFSQSGIYVINFTDSWNMISSVTLTSALPSNLVYLYLPVTGVALSKTVVGQGYNLSVSVAVADLGGSPETFNVTVYANATCIAAENVTLSSGSSANMIFTWNTSGFAYGNYTINAYVWRVSNQTDLENNNLNGGVVYVGIPGDINGDGTVDLSDAVMLSTHFLETLGMPGWNQGGNNADINNDGTVDILDAIIIVGNFLAAIP
jgi:hypothetical protein